MSLQQNTRGHALKLFYPDSRVGVRAHSFPVRVVSLWNRLAWKEVSCNCYYWVLLYFIVFLTIALFLGLSRPHVSGIRPCVGLSICTVLNLLCFYVRILDVD